MLSLGFKDVETSRNASRMMDAKKVDLVGLPFHVQCKHTLGGVNYIGLLKEMPANLPNVIFHSKKNHEMVVMDKEFFYTLIKEFYKLTQTNLEEHAVSL